ncbi:PspA/IM30 family protein [Pseudoalteromonas sp. MB41]|uniref:PspA/IM30 family protein n=1 Tax=Pseudoalteromonas sp. MB41 TaxID=2896366 RepID=UPI001E5BD9AE|nr:PspA/IM30 family protein [Pseudoalteromonas sp. MB41]MCC9661544.1 PspA/IM30 family protein [Pseudoalteromonas sp. MB41]
MGVLNRVNDIIQANLSAALDKAEDPEKLLNLLVQEMQDALNECRATAATFLTQEKQIKREIAAKQAKQADWQAKAEKALSKDRDDLAKAALIEKQRLNAEIEAQQREMDKVADSLAKLTDDSQRLQNKLADAKAKQLTYMQKERVVTARLKVKEQLHSNKVADALARFDYLEQRVENIESQVEAYELTHSDAANSTAAQIAALEKNDAIDKELADLKATMKQSA